MTALRRVRRRAAGFTLVEVLVALFVMALMAALAWQGIDGVMRSRDAGRDAVDRTTRLVTLMSQWETDLQSLHDGSGTPTLRCDGRSLRLVRRVDGGVQLVAWTVNGGTWQRWASPTTTVEAELQQAWLRSQQLVGDEVGQVRLLDGVGDWQLYYFRGNAWSNCQSTADQAAPAEGASPAPTEALPAAVRLVLQIDGQTLTRDIAVVRAS